MSASQAVAAPSPLLPTTERRGTQAALIAVTVALLVVLLLLPLVVVFVEAFAHGVPAVLHALVQPESVASFWLSLLVAVIIGRFRFPGRSLLITLIELPFSVSPVISGLVWVLLFGANGWLGPLLDRAGIRIVFALPGLVLATVFVTFPYIARTLIPLMQDQGASEEEAAITLGATGWQTFRRVTLPNIRWGLLYGVLLCNARAMGEFGAVSVVSGHIRGLTMTMPLQIEALFNDYDWVGAFTIAALLSLLALLTLVAKAALEWRVGRRGGGLL
jgi:sulfate transport system permease protein